MILLATNLHPIHYHQPATPSQLSLPARSIQSKTARNKQQYSFYIATKLDFWVPSTTVFALGIHCPKSFFFERTGESCLDKAFVSQTVGKKGLTSSPPRITKITSHVENRKCLWPSYGRAGSTFRSLNSGTGLGEPRTACYRLCTWDCVCRT